jgi:uncharacterized protein YdiU (UPF0061 family)
MPVSANYRPSTRHQELGAGFFDPVGVEPFAAHTLRWRNQRHAASVGLDGLSDEEWLAHFGRFEPLPGSFETPLALRYHGHQFGHYNPDLGDGRGVLFAQLFDGGGRLLDLGTKGTGRTPWSRGGDGRLTLKGAVRELLATEMLEAQGVYTSKTFSLVETHEDLFRHDEPSPTRSAVMVRLSHSHVRFGSFQRPAYERSRDRLERLLRFSVDTYYPQLSDAPDLPAAFLAAVAERSAEMAARWTTAGFVHGVLNTDNMNINGESFDYGPWRFLPTLDPEFTAAYFDHGGLFAFGRQPAAVGWNVAMLGSALVPIGDKASLTAAANAFDDHYAAALTRAWRERLGVTSKGQEADEALVGACMDFLRGTQAPYHRFFYDWHGGLAAESRARRSLSMGHYLDARFTRVLRQLEGRDPVRPEALDHPYFHQGGPADMLIDTMEGLWAPIARDDDWAPLHASIEGIRAMGDALGLAQAP